MSITQKIHLAILASVVALTACSTNNSSYTELGIKCQASPITGQSDKEISGLKLVGTSIADAEFDSSAAEIVSYDSCTDKIYVVNSQASRVDVLSLDERGMPAHTGSIALEAAGNAAGVPIGAANSVATHNGLIAVAIENAEKQQDGIIALYRSDTLELLATYPAGALPDMVGISKDGKYIATANEGEPNSDYTVDPEGSITIVDISKSVMNGKVHQIGFKEFNEGEARHYELDPNVRISGPNASVAQDLEPEYLTFTDNGKLYVALQENNALAAIDLETKRVESIYGLGGKPWATYELDASNKDKKIGNFKSYPMLEGLYMPDTIDSFTINGQSYIISANEGDGREYGFDTTQSVCNERGFDWDEDDLSGTEKYFTEEGFCIAYVDETRGKKLKIAPEHPLAEQLQDKKALGRLKVVNDKMVRKDEPVYAYGARSFSIWDEKGNLIFDSGDTIGKVAFASDGKYFNSTNDNNNSGDDRSDDKGTEPEAIETASINGQQYVFVGLERHGGIMVFDVTQPSRSQFVTFANNRSFGTDVCTETDDGDCDNGAYNPGAGDLGPESINYFQRNGKHYLAVGNEVSGTTSVFQIEF
ncbi:choice-of-anchor I family protein [Vibrio hannami]|uniref:choice-of-anchor I family protein n=1 Tax=Vibrio hannami TaxID=2717094 RepID=UPI00240F3490|nr:choice-of-anchor I family protein [Vibrio hannami]MDG3085948.1 choice-of-anchor I family protein [Vibrio hannami]